jgi:hypothetical protein
MIDVAITYSPGVDVDALASRLSAAGMVVQQKLDAIRTITGQVEPHRLPQLRSLADVSDASPIGPSFSQA